MRITGMDRLQAQMEPRPLRRRQGAATTVRYHLETRYSPLQQVRNLLFVYVFYKSQTNTNRVQKNNSLKSIVSCVCCADIGLVY